MIAMSSLCGADLRSCCALQLTSKAPETYLDLADDDDSLRQLGFTNGQVVRLAMDVIRSGF